MHTRKLSHRDIKPSNILVVKDEPLHVVSYLMEWHHPKTLNHKIRFITFIDYDLKMLVSMIIQCKGNVSGESTKRIIQAFLKLSKTIHFFSEFFSQKILYIFSHILSTFLAKRTIFTTLYDLVFCALSVANSKVEQNYSLLFQEFFS